MSHIYLDVFTAPHFDSVYVFLCLYFSYLVLFFIFTPTGQQWAESGSDPLQGGGSAGFLPLGSFSCPLGLRAALEDQLVFSVIVQRSCTGSPPAEI